MYTNVLFGKVYGPVQPYTHFGQCSLWIVGSSLSPLHAVWEVRTAPRCSAISSGGRRKSVAVNPDRAVAARALDAFNVYMRMSQEIAWNGIHSNFDSIASTIGAPPL